MFCFDEQYKKNDLYDEGGPGLRLYFNFLKVIILLFAICSVISIPMQLFNIGNYRFQNRINEQFEESENQGSGFFVLLLEMFAVTTLRVSILKSIPKLNKFNFIEHCKLQYHEL